MPLLSHGIGSPGGGDAWHFRAFPSYGRILRNLLTGELSAGLVPWELFVTEVLARPGQKRLWSVPLVVHAFPTELVLSDRARKAINQPRSKASAVALSRLTFAIEARRSLTKLQMATWLNQTASFVPENSQFKMLPMDLMLKGLEAGEIDGFVAPTPWGLQAQSLGHGSVDGTFTQGEFSQELVLVCHRRTGTAHSALMKNLPHALADSRKQLRSPAVFAATAGTMGSLGGAAFDSSLLQAAAARYRPVSPRDFAPDASILLSMLRHLAKFSLLQAALGDLESLSRELVL